jgi:hypothetical protein
LRRKALGEETFMTKWAIVWLILGGSIATSVAGCNIENCEKGAYCGEGISKGRERDNDDEHEQCLHYCERLSVCGAPQARDFDDCVDACEERFDELPEETADLCACIPRSRCEDVIDGRCTGSGGHGGSGGTSATGGSPGQGGYATGGTSNNGGSPETGGTSNNGGSPETGGSGGTSGASGAGGSGETGGASTGGTSHTGGSHSTGGSAAGGSSGGDTGGAGGEDPGTPCTCSCQCLSGQSCVSGYCTG